MTSPMRLRRTIAVQWPYIVRSASGRPAATTVTLGRRSATRAASRPLSIGDPFGVVDGDQDAPRRSPQTAATIDSSSAATTAFGIDDRTQASDRRVRPRAVQHDDAVAVRVAPAGDETDQRRAATAACRPDDEYVFAVGHLETDRRQRGEVDADRQRRRPVAVGGQRERSGIDVVTERADRHRRIAGRLGWPARCGSGSTASCASRRASVSRTRPGIGGGTAAARTPRVAHSIGSSTWNSQRCVSAANAAWGTPPGRSRVATVWIPAATPSVSTRSNRA